MSLLPKREEISDEFDAHDLVQEVSREPMYLDSKGTVNAEYERLNQIARCVLAGSTRSVHSADDLPEESRAAEGSSSTLHLRVDRISHQADGAQQQGTHRAGDS